MDFKEVMFHMACAHSIAVNAMSKQVLKLIASEQMDAYEEYVRECVKRERVDSCPAPGDQLDLFESAVRSLIVCGVREDG